MSKNRKVPVAVLSCFLIAFVLQGILKLNGVFVFEKTLDWDIFRLIDSALWSKIVYYSIIVCATMYCLSFAFTSKCYSKKWYHYVIMVLVGAGITTLRMMKTDLAYSIQILLDVIAYIVVPLVIYFTTKVDERMLGKDLFGVILIIALQIVIYFGYLGLNYWSALLITFIAVNPIYLSSSANFLIQFELYIGLIVFMLSVNMLVQYMREKEREDMFLPINIASRKAKLTAKKTKLIKEVEKIDKELVQLDAMNK